MVHRASRDRIGRITPAGTVTELLRPHRRRARTASSAGPDGNLWFTEHDGRPDRADHADRRRSPSSRVPTPAAGPYGIAAGPGRQPLVHRARRQPDRADHADRRVTEFSAGITAGSVPLGIAAGPDGNLWFTELDGNRIGRITPGGAVTEFPGITANSEPTGSRRGRTGNVVHRARRRPDRPDHRGRGAGRPHRRQRHRRQRPGHRLVVGAGRGRPRRHHFIRRGRLRRRRPVLHLDERAAGVQPHGAGERDELHLHRHRDQQRRHQPQISAVGRDHPYRSRNANANGDADHRPAGGAAAAGGSGAARPSRRTADVHSARGDGRWAAAGHLRGGRLSERRVHPVRRGRWPAALDAGPQLLPRRQQYAGKRSPVKVHKPRHLATAAAPSPRPGP